MRDWCRVASLESTVVLPAAYLMMIVRHQLFTGYTLYVCDPECRRVERGLYPGVELRGLLQETGVAADLPSAAEYLLQRCDKNGGQD